MSNETKMVKGAAMAHTFETNHVCHALWEAGFDGVKSAEHGPVMTAAKEKVYDAFQAGAAWKDARVKEEIDLLASYFIEEHPHPHARDIFDTIRKALFASSPQDDAKGD